MAFYYHNFDHGHNHGLYTPVYIDGACINNGYRDARAGIGVFWYRNSPDNISEPVYGNRQTSNVAEIKAATTAVFQAARKGITHLEIFTDSNFLVSCMTRWMDNWIRNGWITATNQPVMNRDYLEELNHAVYVSNMDIRWTYVRGHNGNYGNEEANRLARAGARM